MSQLSCINNSLFFICVGNSNLILIDFGDMDFRTGVRFKTDWISPDSIRFWMHPQKC